MLSLQPENALVLRRYAAKLRSLFNRYKLVDGAEPLPPALDAAAGGEPAARISLRELNMLMTQFGQMDTRFGLGKLTTAFIAANGCGVVDDQTWDTWNWELDYPNFVEAIVRIAEIKCKTQEGELAGKLDRFLNALNPTIKEHKAS